jgi:hypothetical protein
MTEIVPCQGAANVAAQYSPLPGSRRRHGDAKASQRLLKLRPAALLIPKLFFWRLAAVRRRHVENEPTQPEERT